MKNLSAKYLVIIITCLLFHSCMYDFITHLTDEELEWITNRHVGEKMSFQSQYGINDTVVITNIDIWNSTNPINWNYYIHGKNEYIACATVHFSSCSFSKEYEIVNKLAEKMHFQTDMGRESFYIVKKYNNQPICFGASIFEKSSIEDMYLKDSCMQINGTPIEDIVFFSDSIIVTFNPYISPIPIVSFAWSKKYGLVQYTFEDGTVFNRTDLE